MYKYTQKYIYTYTRTYMYIYTYICDVAQCVTVCCSVLQVVAIHLATPAKCLHCLSQHSYRNSVPEYKTVASQYRVAKTHRIP